MTGRDRIVVMVVAVVAVIGAAWVLVVSPERDKAKKVQAQVSTAKSQLAAAENELKDARSAQQQYASSYAAIVRLGKAVPADQEVPSLMYQVAQASGKKDVEFQSIVAGAPGSGGPAAAGASSSSSSVAVTPAAFTQMPFTFVFNGTYFDLEKLLHNLDAFTVRSTKGGLHVSGRLLTIQSIKLAPRTEVAQKETGKKGPQPLSGTITATAYVLPASQGLTGGATPSSPSTAASGTTTASTGSSSPVPTASVTP